MTPRPREIGEASAHLRRWRRGAKRRFETVVTTLMGIGAVDACTACACSTSAARTTRWRTRIFRARASTIVRLRLAALAHASAQNDYRSRGSEQGEARNVGWLSLEACCALGRRLRRQSMRLRSAHASRR